MNNADTNNADMKNVDLEATSTTKPNEKTQTNNRRTIFLYVAAIFAVGALAGASTTAIVGLRALTTHLQKEDSDDQKKGDDRSALDPRLHDGEVVRGVVEVQMSAFGHSTMFGLVDTALQQWHIVFKVHGASDEEVYSHVVHTGGVVSHFSSPSVAYEPFNATQCENEAILVAPGPRANLTVHQLIAQITTTSVEAGSLHVTSIVPTIAGEHAFESCAAQHRDVSSDLAHEPPALPGSVPTGEPSSGEQPTANTSSTIASASPPGGRRLQAGLAGGMGSVGSDMVSLAWPLHTSGYCSSHKNWADGQFWNYFASGLTGAKQACAADADCMYGHRAIHRVLRRPLLLRMRWLVGGIELHSVVCRAHVQEAVGQRHAGAAGQLSRHCAARAQLHDL